MVVARPDSTAMKVWFETDVPAEEVAESLRRAEAFARNRDWFQLHSAELFRTHRGKHLCIVGEELFVGDTIAEAYELGKRAHPEDQGLFMWYIPLQRRERV
jgi:hypothetical protein